MHTRPTNEARRPSPSISIAQQMTGLTNLHGIISKACQHSKEAAVLPLLLYINAVHHLQAVKQSV